MQPYQERVVAEQEELFEKLEKLRIFVGSATFVGLPQPERGRLTRQYLAMSSYFDVLNERIALFQE